MRLLGLLSTRYDLVDDEKGNSFPPKLPLFWCIKKSFKFLVPKNPHYLWRLTSAPPYWASCLFACLFLFLYFYFIFNHWRINLSFYLFIYLLFSFIFISWRLITLQYCSGFCHTLTRISHGFTCVPHPDPLSCLPPHPIPLGLPTAPGLSTCLMHPTWTGDLFHTW